MRLTLRGPAESRPGIGPSRVLLWALEPGQSADGGAYLCNRCRAVVSGSFGASDGLFGAAEGDSQRAQGDSERPQGDSERLRAIRSGRTPHFMQLRHARGQFAPFYGRQLHEMPMVA